MTNKNGGANDVKFDGSVPDASTDVDNAGSITPTIFNYTANVIQVVITRRLRVSMPHLRRSKYFIANIHSV